MIQNYGSQWNVKTLLKEKYLILYREPGGDVSIMPASEYEYNEWIKEGRPCAKN